MPFSMDGIISHRAGPQYKACRDGGRGEKFMKHWNSLAGCCLAVAVMFLLSVSVHPAMAAEAINKEIGNCATCGGGMDDLSSLPGFENKKVPIVNIREIAPDSSFAKSSGPVNTRTATVAGTQKIRQGYATLDIQDPRSQVAGGSRMSAVADQKSGPVSSVIANMSSEGYDLTADSTHRYESTLTSDDFLALNSSQKAALTSGGFTFTGKDTVVSDRDVTYFTFTNRTTHTIRYMMAIQRLDANGNPVGEREVAQSPEFSADGTRPLSTFGPASASGGSCWWKWVVVVLCAIGLIINIVAIIAASYGSTAAYIFDALAQITLYVIMKTTPRDPRPFQDTFYKTVRPLVIVVAIITLLLMLIALAYSIYDLGVCMGWWDPLDKEEFIWSYQHRFTDADNGKKVPVSLHDRFALALFADTRVDGTAHWKIVSQSEGLKIRDEMTVKNNNGTIQSWLVNIQTPGPQELVLQYVTSKPVPETVPGTRYSLTFTVAGGEWKIVTLDKAKNSAAVGQYSSLAIDRTASPHISYYDAAHGRIGYAVRTDNKWTLENVAGTAGTYTTSLALDAKGNPAVSFGDGYHYGNLMYAYRNGSVWSLEKVDNGGSLGNVGHYSSLVIDPAGRPHITYNDGNHFATLMYATKNGTSWSLSKVDTSGAVGDTGYDSSLVLDPAGRPSIAYRDGKYYANLMVAKQDNAGNWEITKVDNGGSTTGNTGYDPSIALDPARNPHVSYYDKSKGDLRYASWNGTSWITETVDEAGDVGQQSSLAVGTNGQPYISYYDVSQKELHLATRSPGTLQWVIRTVDNDGDVGQHSSIALDPSGHPCISYYDATNNALKFAG
jgi:hypothetical protein